MKSFISYVTILIFLGLSPFICLSQDAASSSKPDIAAKENFVPKAEAGPEIEKPAPGTEAANSQLDNANPVKKPKLSAEEIAHKKFQEKLDKDAIENARNIRVKLRDMMRDIYDFSPKVAKFLAQKYMGIRLVQYLASLGVLLLTFVVARFVLCFVFNRLDSAFSKRKRGSYAHAFIVSIRKPLGMCIWVVGIYFAIILLVKTPAAVAIISRATGILFWANLFWGVVIINDAFFGALKERLKARSASSTANLIEFLRRVLKSFIIIVAILSILTNCGVNVNTIIASLGIGGMALAFASQDTIANFFGSVSIIIDRPFIVGDWVKTTSCEGHVESIGFRSTRIRTFSKTLVTIPNSTLAKESVENFTKMPVRRVVQTIGLTYSTSSEQMEEVIAALRETIGTVEGVDTNSDVSVEFSDFGASSLDISVIYYAKQIDYAYYMATRRRVNLAIMRVVAARNLSFAFPSTSIYIETPVPKGD